MATFTLTRYTRTEDGARVWDGEPIVRETTEGPEFAQAWADAAFDEAMGYGFTLESSGIVGTKVHRWLRHADGRQLHITYTTR